jgi:hypothetical protein
MVIGCSSCDRPTSGPAGLYYNPIYQIIVEHAQIYYFFEFQDIKPINSIIIATT